MPAASPPIRRVVVCPACGGESVYSPENPFRPFCSERCKNVDFGAWATESYRVGTPPSSEDSTETDDDSPPEH